MFNDILFKYRVADKDMKDGVAAGKIYICERHLVKLLVFIFQRTKEKL